MWAVIGERSVGRNDIWVVIEERNVGSIRVEMYKPL